MQLLCLIRHCSFLLFQHLSGSRAADYAARRAGGEQENLRRAQSHRESPPPAQQSSSYEARSFEWGADTGHSDSWSSERRPVSPDPRIVRRRSVDYASRRSGGDPENQRRSSSPVTQRRVSRDPAPQNGSYSSYTSNTSPSSLHPPQGGPKMDPRVQRRKSVNYEARRSGSTRGRSAPVRRSSSRRVSTRQVPSEPLTNANPTQYRSSSSEPHVLPRKSVDYSARRTGGDPENARRRIAASPGSAASRNPAPSVIQRKSVDYASRRSGGQEENLRRRSQDFSIPPGSGAPPQVPVTASEALERVRQLASRRRSVPDYASRRSSASAQEYNTRHRSTSSPPAPSASAPASSNGAAYDSNYSSNNGAARRAEERANKPYIARKSVPSYASRRSQDFPGRPGDPRRRRSMARFTLAEVKTALANRKRSLSGTSKLAAMCLNNACLVPIRLTCSSALVYVLLEVASECLRLHCFLNVQRMIHQEL